MADLDEELLPSVGIGDFSATLETGTPNRLRIAVWPVNSEPTAGLTASISQALLRVEALRSAIDEKLIAAEVSLLDAPPPPVRGKRVISRVEPA